MGEIELYIEKEREMKRGKERTRMVAILRE